MRKGLAIIRAILLYNAQKQVNRKINVNGESVKLELYSNAKTAWRIKRQPEAS